MEASRSVAREAWARKRYGTEKFFVRAHAKKEIKSTLSVVPACEQEWEDIAVLGISASQGTADDVQCRVSVARSVMAMKL
jgi:hypothetical protein